MAKKITAKPAQQELGAQEWIGQAADGQPQVPAKKQKPYKEKKAKGRPISMTDAFYEEVKAFAAAHPELRSISDMTSRALREFMEQYPSAALARKSEEQARKIKEYAEWTLRMEQVWKDKPAG